MSILLAICKSHAGLPVIDNRRIGGDGFQAAQLSVKMDGSDIASAHGSDRRRGERPQGAAASTRSPLNLRLEHELQTVW
jgi:hypothetical protein